MWLSFNTLALIAALLLMSIVGGNSKILKGPVDTEVKVGDSAFLNCSISDPFADLSWLHYPAGKGTENHQYVYIRLSETLHSPYDKRFRIEKEMSDNNSFSFNLVLQNAEPSDAGLYVCQNGGSNLPFPAELIITDSNPVCVTNINSVGFIGPNSCGVNRDAVQLSCGVGYSGNVPPRIQWTLIRNGNARPLPQSQSCSHSGGSFVTCNCTAFADIEMDGAYFACQTNRSRNVQRYCRTDAVKILYAVGEKMPTQRMVGDAVTCSANTGSLTCGYRWIWSDAESERTMSEDEHLTITKAGLHRCRANCHIDQQQCSFDAMTVVALNTPETSSSSSSTIPVIIAVSLTILCCVAVFVAVVVAVVFCRRRRKLRERHFPDIKLDVQCLQNGIGKPLLAAASREKENDVLVMNVDPIPIEEAVKAELWFISNCMLVGHNREFLSILLTFKAEQDARQSRPGDKLLPIIPEMLKLVKSAGDRNANKTVAEKKCNPLKKAIKEGIDRVNSNNVCHGHQIKKWAIMSNDFSVEGGELDATMKLNRSRVAEKYQKKIDLIYENSGCDLILEAPNESNADV